MPETLETPTDSVEIDLGDGKIRHLRYTLGSLRRLKKKFGATMLSVETLSAIDEDRLADLLYEGLTDKGGLSLDEMADLIDARRIKTLVEAFSLAFSGSMPEKNAPRAQAAIQ